MLTFLKTKAIFGFFIFYLLLGVLIFRDYGFTWDDQLSRLNGIMAFDYIAGANSNLLTYVDRDYGTAFELPLVVIEKALHLTSTQQIFFMRYFVTFLFYFVGTIFFYLLARKRFGNLFGFLGLIFLILSPRIFADSFYNSKDIGLLSIFTIAIFTMKYFLDHPTWRSGIVHGLICALVVDIRMPGVIILGLTFGFLLLDAFFLKKNNWKSLSKPFLLFLASFGIFTILFWPYLWLNPVGNFLQAFSNLSHFVRWDDTVLYLGKFVKAAHDLPWHYSLVWISITTPLTYLIFFAIGVVAIILRFAKKPLAFYGKHRDDLIFISWFVLPLLSVIVLHSVIYDGWRQLYFIYPALILISLIGMEYSFNLFKKSNIGLYFKIIIVTFILINLSNVLFFMIMYHPYQNLYFNALAGGIKNAKKNFELDYYGTTFRKGLEYIVATDASEKMSVFFSHGIQNNIDMLSEENKKRFVPLAQPNGAKYILTNYRWHPQDYSPDYNKVYEITIDGVSVMSVFKFY